MNATGGGVLAVVGRVPLQWLPERYRQPMRDYLGQGVLPEPPPLRLLLEGNLDAVRAFACDLPEVAALLAWVEEYLPAYCWGNRDQVQLWVVYVRRARGRVMLEQLGWQ